jgi:hypothetical protein
MRCYIIPIAVHRLTKLRRTGRTPVFPLLQFFDHGVIRSHFAHHGVTPQHRILYSEKR